MAVVQPPNVIEILADDMGYGDFGVFGDGSSQTPALDRLVAESVCLTQHYSASAVCAPARATLLTGRYPHRTGAIDTLEARGLDRLALREVTVGNLFQAANYATGLIGKWHLGALDPRYHPNARGFGEFVGFRGGWSDYYQWRLDYNGRFQKTDGRYLTDVFTEEAVQFVRRHRHEPFFLHLAYNAPHFPLQAPETEIALFQRGTFTTALRTLYAMIHRMDAGIGHLLEELERLGLRENTVVLFTSDNGPQVGGQGDASTNRFNAHFRGHKGNVFEGGIRVPAIVRWPAGLGGNRRVTEMVHFADWLPTLAAMAGQQPPAELALDGASVLPVLRSESRETIQTRFWQWNRYTPLVTCNAAVRDGAWKLVRPVIREAMALPPEETALDRRIKYEPESITDIDRSPEPERRVPPPPPPMLFNVEDDPYEEHDLAEAQPERMATLLHRLETWFEDVDAERRSIRD